MDTRVQFVETKITERSHDTKPIWEQALSEIMEIKERLGGMEQGLVGVKQELDGLKHELGDIKHELDGLKLELGTPNTN